jgi:hypothetical protein
LRAGLLPRLTEAMTAWAQGSRLDAQSFAHHFFHRDAADAVVTSLRDAAVGVATATRQDELAAASKHLADAMTAEALDTWPRFVAHALARARDPATLAAITKSLQPPDLRRGAIKPVYPVETALAAGAAAITGGVSGLVGAAARAIGGAIASKILADKPAATPGAPTPSPTTLQVWTAPKDVTEKIPPKWGAGRPTKKGIGLRWTDPKNPKGNIVRVDKGDPNSTYLTQRIDHVVVQSDGKIIGRDGKPIAGSVKNNFDAAHIPLTEYRTWSRWNTP